MIKLAVEADVDEQLYELYKKGQRRSKAKVEMRVFKQCSCFNFSESVFCGRISHGWWKMNKNMP